MGQKKNDLKKTFTNCFYCGCELDDNSNKIIHRINVKKNICKNNIVILCKKCKYKFTLSGYKIFASSVDKRFIKLYFRNVSIDYKKSIIKSLKLQADIYEKNEENKN